MDAAMITLLTIGAVAVLAVKASIIWVIYRICMG